MTGAGRQARLAAFALALTCWAAPALAGPQVNRLVQASPAAAEAAAKAIREGRDFIQSSRWQQAAEKFQEVVSRYPESGQVDAALYWFAYALSKQGDVERAFEAIEQLAREYPKSEWFDDARALRVEVERRLGREPQVDVDDPNEDCEIKLMALRSIFDSNPERAMAHTAEILRPNSRAPECLQNGALMLLGHAGGPQARKVLVEYVRDGSKNPEARKAALMSLAHSGGEFDDATYAMFRDLALGQDEEMSKAAIFAISQDENPRSRQLLVEIAKSAPSPEVRQQAVFWLGQREGALDDLLNIYNGTQEPELKKQALFAISQNNDARAEQLLLQIARTGGDAELRKQAIFFLSQREGCGAVDTLSQVYDAEKDVEVKKHVIFALGQNSCKPALLKLINIGRSESDPETRKTAIFWIGQREDPEALKFLEELLK